MVVTLISLEEPMELMLCQLYKCFPLVDMLKKLSEGDESVLQKLQEISSDFGVDSGGVFIGCIGAIDGLAIRIKCPLNVRDPGNYFSRKKTSMHSMFRQYVTGRRGYYGLVLVIKVQHMIRSNGNKRNCMISWTKICMTF